MWAARTPPLLAHSGWDLVVRNLVGRYFRYRDDPDMRETLFVNYLKNQRAKGMG